MADYVPKGLFNDMTQIELDALRANALLRITDGDFTNLSGAMKSSTRAWAMSPQDILEEVKYAEQINSGQARATRVYSDLRSRPSGRVI
jgi:hypothetical protein